METSLKSRQIILGVSGGIAAYKSVELLRLMRDAGAAVRVMMTRNATWFVGPTTFEALAGQPVCTDLFDDRASDASIRHIDWATEADAVVIAPATANVVGKIAAGIADDALTTLVLAVTAPILICPAMNTHMYQNRQVQRNLRRLENDGYHILPPESGQLACGTVGPGRLPAPAAIFDRLATCLAPHDYSGQKLLVTAGPTWEPIDPVRFITNPSTGKMGYAVARAAAQRGAQVCLISGPTHLDPPPGVTVVRVQTAQEMADAVFHHLDDIDIIIKTAAVSDYRPDACAPQKLKKNAIRMQLSMEKTVDILKKLGADKNGRVLVGFAAETENLSANALQKLEEKNLDLIVGNRVDRPDSGFASDTNAVTLYYRDGSQEALPNMPKETVAHTLLDRIAERILGN